MARAYNFFAGPAVLPVAALERAQKELLDWDNTGTSVMETSHRSKEYEAVHNEAISLITELIGLPAITRSSSCRAGRACSSHRSR